MKEKNPFWDENGVPDFDPEKNVPQMIYGPYPTWDDPDWKVGEESENTSVSEKGAPEWDDERWDRWDDDSFWEEPVPPVAAPPKDDRWQNELSTDYEDRCGNCHELLEHDDVFCRYCGTRRGEGAFEPYENLIQEIYGPMPVERIHTCPNCGYTWNTMLMIDHEDFCPKCGSAADMQEIEEEEDEGLSTDYEGRCGNCHKRLEEEDAFCRHCGTRRGEGAFEPYENVVQMIYGPMPVNRMHICTSCGHVWDTMLMIDDEDFCPKCGNPAAAIEMGLPIDEVEEEDDIEQDDNSPTLYPYSCQMCGTKWETTSYFGYACYCPSCRARCFLDVEWDGDLMPPDNEDDWI